MVFFKPRTWFLGLIVASLSLPLEAYAETVRLTVSFPLNSNNCAFVNDLYLQLPDDTVISIPCRTFLSVDNEKNRIEIDPRYQLPEGLSEISFRFLATSVYEVPDEMLEFFGESPKLIEELNPQVQYLKPRRILNLSDRDELQSQQLDELTASLELGLPDLKLHSLSRLNWLVSTQPIVLKRPVNEEFSEIHLDFAYPEGQVLQSSLGLRQPNLTLRGMIKPPYSLKNSAHHTVRHKIQSVLEAMRSRPVADVVRPWCVLPELLDSQWSLKEKVVVEQRFTQ